MRVLHVGKYFPPYAGGMENFIGDLLPALNNYGVETAALVHADPRQEKSSFRKEDYNGSPVWRVPCHGTLLYAPISPGFLNAFNKVIAAFRPEIIHFHLPNTSAFLGLLLKQAKAVPWIVHWHSDVVPSRIDWRLALAYQVYRPFEQTFLSRAEKIITTSPNYQASSVPLVDWKEKCEVVPLGIAPERMVLAVERPTLFFKGDTSFKLVCVGRLTYYKGHETLIRAAALVDNLELLIVGTGENLGKLEALISSLGLAERVRLTGFQSEKDLHEIIAASDCLALPSEERTEAFGLVLLEAMCYGKPVLVCDVPGSGMGWVVDSGETGVLVPPADPVQLAVAIRGMAANKKDTFEMGLKGQAKYRNMFTIGTVAEKIASIYNNILP